MRNWFKALSKRSSVARAPAHNIAQPAEESPVPPEELLRRMTLPQTDRETFFLLYSKLAEQKHGATELEFVGDATLSMKRSDGKQQTIHLSNLWIACKDSPGEARVTIERHLTLVDGPAASDSLRREQIVPMIKDLEYFSIFSGKLEIVRQHLVADLYIVYGADSEHSMRTISRSEIEALAIQDTELLPLALENLQRLLPEIQSHDQGSWHFLTAGNDYVASLLLLDNVWEFAADEVEGDVVAVAPTRDTLMFTGASSAEGIGEIRRLANEIVGSGHHVISATLLRRVEGRWKSFD